MKKREGLRPPLLKPEDNPAYGSGGGYSIAYLDPSWPFRVWDHDTGAGRSAEAHYPTMTLADIGALPIKKLLAKDAMCYLWCTPSNLPDALLVGKTWGLTYVTVAHFWVKLNKNALKNFSKNGLPPDSDAHWFKSLGHTTRSNVEVLLLFKKGRGLKRVDKSVRQPIFAPVSAHSAKPHEAYERIKALYGEQKRLELFARNLYPDFHSLGNEIDGLDIREAIARVLQPPAAPLLTKEWYQMTLDGFNAPQIAS